MKALHRCLMLLLTAAGEAPVPVAAAVRIGYAPVWCLKRVVITSLTSRSETLAHLFDSTYSPRAPLCKARQNFLRGLLFYT